MTQVEAPSVTADDHVTAGWQDRLKDVALGTTLVGMIIRAVSLPLILYLLIFIVALWRAWVDPIGSAAYFEYVRGLFDLIVAIGSIIIIVASGVLVIQIARFVNLVRSEVKPIADDTKHAVGSIRATASFVQQHAVKPIIQTQSIAAGIMAFLAEIIRISRILQKKNEPSATDSDD